MTKTTVFHIKKDSGLLFNANNKLRIPISAIKPVAKIEGSDKDNAYYLTNSIDSSWVKNENVDVVSEDYVNGLVKGLRSTSVGDVILTEENGTEKYWVVDDFGFNPLEMISDYLLNYTVAS